MNKTIHIVSRRIKSFASFAYDNVLDLLLKIVFIVSVIFVFFLLLLITSPLFFQGFICENSVLAPIGLILQKSIKEYLSFFLSIQNTLLTSNSSSYLNSEINYGLNGDAFGVINPFIAFLAAILTFIAFLTQYMANRRMVQDNKKQQIERQFYEMLRIHQENIQNFHILTFDMAYAGFREVKSREVFRILNAEFNHIFQNTTNNNGKEEHFRDVYQIFFFGKNSFSEDLQEELNEIGIKQSIVPPSEFATGHVFLFDHYYRHLYCMVRFIAKSKLFSDNEKKDFLKIIRAQMTPDEQALLLYNWHYGLGKPWEDEGVDQHFFSKYQMIHNIFSSSTIFSEEEIFAMFPNVPDKVKEKMFEHFKFSNGHKDT